MESIKHPTPKVHRQSMIEVLPRILVSKFLDREVRYDIYTKGKFNNAFKSALLLINDGQDLHKMDFEKSFESILNENSLMNHLCVGIHAGEQRKFEYGVIGHPDYMLRGNMADAYNQFVLKELLPALFHEFNIQSFHEMVYLGFSLGGLSAFDQVLSTPQLFKAAGVFSGSFWWRSKELGNEYDDNLHRIMHKKIRSMNHHPHLRFFFEAGAMDETADRNKNGIIDSIDDTMDIIKELEKIGYQKNTQIRYEEMPEGRHNLDTWATVLPVFMNWLISK